MIKILQEEASMGDQAFYRCLSQILKRYAAAFQRVLIEKVWHAQEEGKYYTVMRRGAGNMVL